MKRRLGITVVAVLAVVLAWASVVRVPADGGAWSGGRFMGPGLQLKAPWAAVHRYPGGSRTLDLKLQVAPSDGGLLDFRLRVSYRWDLERLAQDPMDPELLPIRVRGMLDGLNGLFEEAAIGRGVNEELSGILESLPVAVLEAEATYDGMVFESLRASASPTGERVVLVGFDGLDWVLLNRLIGEGRCPTFARMKRTGAWSEMLSHQPVLSPLIWTSMGSGRLPEVHGILDFVVMDPKSGRDIPITNQSRKVHAYWNILSYLDMTVNVVNWWATYPAEPVNGIMVSERMFYQLFGIRPPLDDPANVFPHEVLADILPLLVDVDDVGWGEVSRYAAIDRSVYEQGVEEAAEAENPYDNRINHLRKILAVTRGVFNIGRWMLENHPADHLALYIEGTDTIGHRFAHFLPPKLSWVSQEDYDAYQGTMAAYYELVDRELGQLIRLAPADTTWIVVADHGFFTGAARPSVLPDDFGVGAAQWHRMVGVFMAMGPSIRPGKLSHSDVYDLCRTVLWLHGAPISRDLQGRELVEMLEPGWAEDHPPIYVDTFEELPRTWTAEGAASVLDEARMKELEALGYLSSGGASVADRTALDEAGLAEHRSLGYVMSTDGSARAGARTPATGGAGGAKPTEAYNLAKLAENRGDYEAAERHYLQALEIRPDFAHAMMALGRLYRGQERHLEALRWYTRALQTGKETLPPAILEEFVVAAQDAGRLDRALGALDMVRARWGHEASFDSARGLALRGLGQVDEAEAAYRAALDKDPAAATATDELMSMASQGRAIDVEPILRRHFEAVRDDLKRLNSFAVVCLRNRRPDWGERALRLLVESDPTNGGILSNLAAALQQQGELQEAADILERAAVARPDDPGIAFNLGAVLASLGREAEAIAWLDKAAELGLKGPRIFSARAKVLFRLGRIEDVRRVLEEGVRQHPGDPELRELLAALG